MIDADLVVLLGPWIYVGVPIGAMSGGLAGFLWARAAWRPDAADWWLAGAVAATAFGIGLVAAGVWGFVYASSSDLRDRMAVALIMVLGGLPMVVVAFLAALAWIALMHLAAKITKPSR
jgi:hypothetical protein